MDLLANRSDSIRLSMNLDLLSREQPESAFAMSSNKSLLLSPRALFRGKTSVQGPHISNAHRKIPAGVYATVSGCIRLAFTVLWDLESTVLDNAHPS